MASRVCLVGGNHAASSSLVLKNKEVERTANTRFEWGAFKSFKQTHIIALGVLGALYLLIINGANQIVNPFLADRFSTGDAKIS